MTVLLHEGHAVTTAATTDGPGTTTLVGLAILAGIVIFGYLYLRARS